MEYYKNLVQELNDATKAYDEGKPYMSDWEWDSKYWELVQWEQIHGMSLPESPTRQISYEVVNSLEKVTHYSPMLSLDKTKSVDALREFQGEHEAFLSLKLDGLTCRLTYRGGRLICAETRGNGIVGENITHNAKVIPSIPNHLDMQVDLVVDGEVICTDRDFLPFSEEYKNSRNFAAGSIRLLDAKECEKRNLTFVAWNVVEGADDVNDKRHTNKLLQLKNYSKDFITVPFLYCVEGMPLEKQIEQLKEVAQIAGYPIDGLVLKYDSIDFGNSLGATAHHFRNAIAYKFFDESYPTTLRSIEWSAGRTGQLTPIAIFDTIEIDGSEVSRASLHNISVMQELSEGVQYVGDTLHIFKANAIIPQVASWEHSDNFSIKDYLGLPTVCPYCGEVTIIKRDSGTAVLTCSNSACPAMLINRLDHFCSKDKGLDIRGLSKATLEKLLDWGWVNSIIDIFRLERYRDEWIQKPGFGATSVDKILSAIDASRETTLNAFICSLGIPLIGRTISKQLLEIVSSYEDLRDKVNNGYDFSQHSGFGYEKSKALLEFDYTEADRLYKLMCIETPTAEEKKETLAGKTFCITGKLIQVKNRDELVAIIEANGGRFVKSVSKNTQYLINNDNTSTSAKNKEAQKLGIPIITEEEFFKMI
jgi:DNA ligase (NAD+)